MSKNIIAVLISFFLTSFPFKSFSGQWIELDSSWFGSDWYYDSDAGKGSLNSVYVTLSEYFDEPQQTKDKYGKIYRYNEIRSRHTVVCSNKTVKTKEVILLLNGSRLNSTMEGTLKKFPNIDYGINDGIATYIKFPGALKSPLKKICKIYD